MDEPIVAVRLISALHRHRTYVQQINSLEMPNRNEARACAFAKPDSTTSSEKEDLAAHLVSGVQEGLNNLSGMIWAGRKMPEETPAQLRLGSTRAMSELCVDLGTLGQHQSNHGPARHISPGSRTAHVAAQMRLGVEEKLCMCQSMIGGTREIIPGKLLEIRCVYEYAHANVVVV